MNDRQPPKIHFQRSSVSGRWTLFLLFLFVLASTGISIWLFRDLPGLDDLAGRLAVPSLRITDRHGRLLYEMIPDGGGRHTPVSLESIPLALQQATISTEDASFYANPGVDLSGILRALWINLRGGETLAGGSTITQQVARSLLLEPGERSQRTLRRKLRESWLAWQLARRRSKGEILALYLNQTYYGGLAYGVEAAAQTYFGKPVSELDLAECALLAGLPQAPGRYNPFTDPQAARERQKVVLGLMEKHGLIGAEQRRLAEEEPLVYAETPYPMEAPHFVMMVRAMLDDLLPPGALQAGQALTVHTTLDLDWQRQAERIAREHLHQLNHPSGGEPGHNVQDAALVALDPHTGQILTMLGSPDYFDGSISGAVNMALMPTQPGSAIKPIVYAAAMDPQRPRPWTAATMILDVRTTFPTHSGEPYVPENYDRQEHGPVLAREALASSLNIPAVTALSSTGIEPALRLAKSLGISSLGDPDQYDLTLALGGGAVRLVDLTAAYAAFANGGTRLTPLSILEITNSQGKALYTAPAPSNPRVLDERVTWLISDILSDDDARRIGFGANSLLRLDRTAAVKTGTTTNFHDNWTVGYTPDLVVGVWVGNAGHQPMRSVTGLTGAGPIWHAFMRTVLAGVPEKEFVRPPGLVQVEICALSGLLPTPECPYRRKEWFIAGTQPTSPDNLYRRVAIDPATGRLAGQGTPPERRQEKIVLDLPPQAQPWARSQGLPLLADLLVDSRDVTSPPAGIPALRLVAPDPNSVFYIAGNRPLAIQKLHLEAVGETGLGQVSLWVDGILVALIDRPPYEAWWILQPGEHRAWAEAFRATGERLASEILTFTVRK